MSDDLGFPHDHGEITWNNFLAQHVGKEQTEAFVKAFYGPLNDLDKILEDLYINRWLDTATGDALDGIGSIVGISRTLDNVIYLGFFGFVSQPSGRAFDVARIRLHNELYLASNILGDVEYRILIKLKIGLNNSHGTAEEIMRFMQTALSVPTVLIFDVGNATANLYIGELILSNDPRFYFVDRIIPRLGGVKIWPYFIDPYHTFGFSNQQVYYGFDVGVLARTPTSNIPPIP